MPKCDGFSLSLVGMLMVSAVIFVEAGPSWAILTMGLYIAFAGIIRAIAKAMD